EQRVLDEHVVEGQPRLGQPQVACVVPQSGGHRAVAATGLVELGPPQVAGQDPTGVLVPLVIRERGDPLGRGHTRPRSSRLSTLPDGFRGNASMKTTSLGTLNLASWPRQYSLKTFGPRRTTSPFSPGGSELPSWSQMSSSRYRHCRPQLPSLAIVLSRSRKVSPETVSVRP